MLIPVNLAIHTEKTNRKKANLAVHCEILVTGCPIESPLQQLAERKMEKEVYQIKRRGAEGRGRVLEGDRVDGRMQMQVFLVLGFFSPIL